MDTRILERARNYLAHMPVGISGVNRHAATFWAASKLVNGFGLGEADAWALLQEYNARCQPPSDLKKLQHRLKRAITAGDKRGRGYLLQPGTRIPSQSERQLARMVGVPKEEGPEYKPAYLAKLSAPWRHIDLCWLADRSAVDPACITAGRFLELLYQPNEHVKIFTKEKSQGQILWPCPESEIPTTGVLGVWFLAAPVDGKAYPNPRKPPKKDGAAHFSSRSEESVTSWRWMMIESDKAPTREWLGAIVQLPLRIAAIYTSGGRSVHALIRVDARTKAEWDQCKAELKPWLVMLGADPGAMSAVRLTRLPGCWRRGRLKEVELPNGTKRKKYVSLATAAEPRGVFQKLLYVNPTPDLRPIIDQARLRDVETIWLDYASVGMTDSDETGGEWLKKGLWYYAPCNAHIREALRKIQLGNSLRS